MSTKFNQNGHNGATAKGVVSEPTRWSRAGETGNALLATAVDRLGAGVFVCDAKKAHCPIIQVSHSFTVITRYTADEAMGGSLDFLISSETDPAVVKAINEAANHNQPFQGEFLCSRKGAEPVWCELILTFVPAADGSPDHLVGLLTDITVRKQREEEFKDAEARYRGIFENAVEGIYQSTPEGNYLAVNPALAKMYGYNCADELLNQVSDIGNQIYVDPTCRERFQKEVEQSGQVLGMEYQVRRRDGTVIWISESARVVRDAKGMARYYEGFIDDITPRKEAEIARSKLEKQMIQAQKMEAIGTLAGGIAHDFNNILCAMLGLTELALANEQVTGWTRKNLEAVLKSAGRAKDLIKQILTFSRRGEGERSPVKLNVILRECVKLLNATLPASIEITFKLQSEDDTVVADPTEMHQVMMNLGTNAAHALRGKGGKLEFTLQNVEVSQEQAARLTPLHAGPHVCLVVRDNGHGMSRQIIDDIFDPFFTTKPAGEGTGLGLALVHRIVTRCGGQIAVESQENVGTTFRVYLPKATQSAAVVVPSKSQLMPGRRERLLIVDDEILILGMMQQHLRNMGYRVITRADSTSALEIFQSDPEQFDLVITDHTMPCMEGAELAEKLGEIRADMPIILMTGLNHPPTFAGSLYAARRSVIRKPLDFVDLSQRLRGFLDTAETKAGRKVLAN